MLRKITEGKKYFVSPNNIKKFVYECGNVNIDRDEARKISNGAEAVHNVTLPYLSGLTRIRFKGVSTWYYPASAYSLLEEVKEIIQVEFDV